MPLSDPFAPPETEDDLEDLFENAPCGYLSARPSGRIIRVNRTLAAWLGHDPHRLVGRRVQDLLNIAGKIYYETHFAPLLRMQGFFNEVALDLVRGDGRPLPVLVNAIERRDPAGNVRFIRIIAFNATDRRRYERELLDARRAAEAASESLRELNQTLEARVAQAVEQRMQAEEELRLVHKMDAIGQLTGGLAHDFNNILTGITGILELLETRIRQNRLDNVPRYIEAARTAVSRAATLTHRLLTFARRQALAPEPTDINRVVAGMEELIRRTMGTAVAIEIDAATGPWNTLLDANQLENALLNLCINARDAMPDGGRLTVATANLSLDEPAARERGLQGGEYVSLSVTDTGTGISPEVMGRIFEPFFTTKPIGQGTGLGLSMIYGFVHQSGGQVRVASELGQGTTITLYLPRHEAEPPQPATPTKAATA